MYFSLISDVCTEMVDTNCCNSRATGYEVFVIFIFSFARSAVVIVFQTYASHVFPEDECLVRKPTRTFNLFLVSSSMIFALYLLKFPGNTLECLKLGKFSQIGAASFFSRSLGGCGGFFCK